jgi:hypothetical protein
MKISIISQFRDEAKYLKECIQNYYGFNFFVFLTNPPDLEPLDLYEQWQRFRLDISVLTIPTLDTAKVKEYIYTYVNYIAIQ